MMSPEWDAVLERRAEEEVQEAAMVLLAAQRHRLRLENAELKDIRDRLLEHETELIRSGVALENVLAPLQDVEKVLKAAVDFLEVVGLVVRTTAQL